MVKSWDIEIPSLTGSRKRKAYIYLPEDYETSGRSYPVMYMFDGHNLFSDEEATYGKCLGLSDYLDKTQTPLIIAAVECNTVGHGRLSEYSPVDFDMKGVSIKGRGAKYMNWLVKTFKPFIDENYRTIPDRAHTAIGGSSMGGLMTVYALSRYNKYFSRGAALSPSLWVENGEVPSFVREGKFRKDTVLYTDYGSKEFSNHDVQRKAFSNTLACLVESGVILTARIIAGGTHCEASWERQIPFFMRALGFAD